MGHFSLHVLVLSSMCIIRANHILFYTKIRSSKALVLNLIIRIVSAFKCSLYTFNTFYSNEVVNVFTSRHVR